jgi:hypothetical protein
MLYKCFRSLTGELSLFAREKFLLGATAFLRALFFTGGTAHYLGNNETKYKAYIHRQREQDNLRHPKFPKQQSQGNHLSVLDEDDDKEDY